MKTLSGVKRKIFQFCRNVDEGRYKTRFNTIFQGKSRIEIGLTGIIPDDEGDSCTSYQEIESFLNGVGYEILDYKKGYASKKSDPKNCPVKIGKLLKKNKPLLDKFRDCPDRQSVKLVLSRHPYDIACASYGQDWDSCLNFEDGGYSVYLRQSVKYGNLLVCYTVSDSNIKSKPLGRCFIFEYLDYKWGNTFLKADRQTYGIFNEKFRKFLDDWLDINYNQPKVFKMKVDEVCVRFPAAAYNDNMPDLMIIQNKKIMTDIKFVRKLINTGTLCSYLKKKYEYNEEDLIRELKFYIQYHENYLGLYSKMHPEERKISKNISDYKKLLSVLEGGQSGSIKFDENYIDFIMKIGFKIDKNEYLEKYILKRYNDSTNPFVFNLIHKYCCILKGKTDWKRGAGLAKEIYDNHYVRKPKTNYSTILEKLGSPA